jgi:hypothetical protein
VLHVSRRFIYGTVFLGSFALVGAGFTAGRTTLPASLRPAPQATLIVGTAPGPLFLVENGGTSAFDTYGAVGVAGTGPYAIGVLGYGANSSAANLALTGYDIGPGSVATVGDAVFPEPGTGPGSTATTGVYGLAPDGNGVIGQTSVQHGSFNNSVSGYAGVVGLDSTSNNGHNAGVIGQTTNGAYGVEGISSTGARGGVEALADNGDGLDAFSTSGIGVTAGSVNDVALEATGQFADAIHASTNGNFGVRSFGAAAGVFGDSSNTGVIGVGTDYGVIAQSGAAGAKPFAVENEGGTTLIYADDSGNLYVHGTVHSFVGTRDGNVGQTFEPKSTMQTLEDFGSGSIVEGTGSVALDPSFARMIDGSGYEVFLTPQGDNRGLYIAKKTATSFVVRESQGGRSTLAFDYRIVARQYGHAAERSSIATTAAAFGEPRVPVPSAAQRVAAATRPAIAAQFAAANRRAQSAFVTPRAISGLALHFGH